MFKKMRRSDRSIDISAAEEILKNSDYGVLSTVGENGYAYGVPLNYVFYDNSIFFHSATTGHKLDNISFNNKVSFCTIGKTQLLAEEFSYSYKSVIVFGKAEEALNEEKYTALMELIKKYSGEFMEKGKEYINRDISKTTVIKIIIENITGKSGH